MARRPPGNRPLPEADLESILAAAVLAGQAADGQSAEALATARGARAAILARNDRTLKRRGGSRPWTEAEEEYLRQQLGRLPEAEIARHLGRTETGIHLRRKKLNLIAPSKREDEWPAQRVARLLSVDLHAVMHWISDGRLPARVMPGGRKIRLVPYRAVRRFALTPENWILFKPGRVTDPALRRLIALRRARWGDDWWRIGRVARYHGVASGVIAQRIYRGQLRSAQWGNHYVRRSDALAIRIHRGKGMPGATRLHWGEAADAFLILALAIGLPDAVIARLMGSKRVTIGYRRTRLWRSPVCINALIRRHHLAVRVNRRARRLYADWRRYAGRFPGLARAVDRLEAGQSLTRLDHACLSGLLTNWGLWHARTPEQRQLARRARRYGRQTDEHLRDTARAMLVAYGKPPAGIARLPAPAPRLPRLRNRRSAWAERDDLALQSGLGKLSLRELAGQLGRTIPAVRRRARELGLADAPAELVTAPEVARLLGVTAWLARRWVAQGLLPVEAACGSRRLVPRVALRRFVANPINWARFDAARVTDPGLARLIALRRARWPDEWWTVSAVARHHGVSPQRVAYHIARGRLPAVRTGDRYAVLRSDALAYHFWPGYGPGPQLRRGRWGERAEAFLLAALAVGLPLPVIGRLAKLDRNRLLGRVRRLLRDAGRVRALSERYRLKVEFDAMRKLVFSDWHAHRRRFAFLDRVVRRWRAGEALSDDEASLIGSITAHWLVWHGRRAPSLRRLRTGHPTRRPEALARRIAALGERGHYPFGRRAAVAARRMLDEPAGRRRPARQKRRQQSGSLSGRHHDRRAGARGAGQRAVPGHTRGRRGGRLGRRRL